MKKTFYSNGKLLITGEYVVLDGAQALALPTKFGQSLTVENAKNKSISWTSYDADNTVWFNSEISFDSIISKEKSEKTNSINDTLIDILHEAYNENPSYINNSEGYKIVTELTFPKLWGLGTSSTLINNIAQWLKVDAYKLLKNSFGGSGYDLACAQNDSPIIYQLKDRKPKIKPVSFSPIFSNNIFFIYLNKKQSSKSAISSYFNKQVEIVDTIKIIDAITNEILNSTDVQRFAIAIKKHEVEMSKVLGQQTVQELLFSDFNGVIKSLGAWGGDFVMAISNENPIQYFKSKGFNTILSYDEMIL